MADLIQDLAAEKHLSPRQLRAAGMFLRELQAHHGHSAGLVMHLSEKIDAGRQARLRPPGGASIAALDSRLGKLHQHERVLLAALVRHGEKGKATLSDYGKARSNYQTQRTSKAFATGRVSALLETLADTYFGPINAEKT
jgi:hypothetical protein